MKKILSILIFLIFAFTASSADYYGTKIPSSTTATAGKTRYATSAETVTGTETSAAVTPAGLTAATAVVVNPKEMSQAVNMTAAASGSNGIAAASTSQNNMATNNFSPWFKVLLPDWTPSAEQIILQKHDGTNGWKISIATTGLINITINSTVYTSSVAPGWTDGTEHEISTAITRSSASAAGSIVVYGDGTQIGDAIVIAAGDPVTVDNTSSMYVMGTSTTRTVGLVNNWGVYNYALTSTQATTGYRNGVVWADQVPGSAALYTSDFSVAADSFTGASGTVTGNIDSITDGTTSKNNVLRYYASNANNNMHYASRTISDFDLYRSVNIVFSYYIPAGQTNVAKIEVRNTVKDATVLSTVGTWTKVFISTVGTSSSALTLRFYARNAAETEFVGANSSTDDRFYISDMIVTYGGAIADYEPEDIQKTQWTDSSIYGNDASFPAAGAAPTRSLAHSKYRTPTAMVSDTTLTSIIPAGYTLEKIVFYNSTANAATLRLGSTADTNDVMTATAVAASGYTTWVINKTFSSSAAQTLYLNDESDGNWNSASLTATFFFIKY